jgi:tetratricopeptide (TPR) repeat protein
MRRPASLVLALVAMIGAAANVVARQEHQHGAGGRLGTVTFSNSCSTEVQPGFAEGMALLHSFEFGPAIDAFKAVAGKDASCGIAYWGMAVAQWGNPFAAGTKPPAALQAGREFIARAKAAGAKSERERDYISAASALYDNMETVDQRTRLVAYRDLMARVAATYPSDTEAAAFHALALAACADPADKTYADQLKAGATLERLWKAQPDHPGLPHYLIHAYDVPALASRAVAAARSYAKIAPAAPHALHMPSHTFTRLGYWQDSIDTNILSAETARKAGALSEELHAIDYQTYAYLQTAQDAAAKRLVETVRASGDPMTPRATASAAPAAAGVFAQAAVPARYALERGAWTEATRLEVHPTRGMPQAEAMTWFARGLGAARSADIALAKTAVDELQKLIDRLTESKESYWTEQVTIQKLGASAWLALAEGRNDEALTAMRSAAAREDRTEKNAITPGPLAPAHELLGEMLLQLKQPKEALAEFQKTMAKEPNRFRGIAGAAAAAAQAGDTAAARTYYQQLLTVCAKADTPGRPELDAARRATQSNAAAASRVRQ